MGRLVLGVVLGVTLGASTSAAADPGDGSRPVSASEGPSAEAVILRTLPFGVGQFLNGDPGLGVYFLTVEASAFVLAGVSYSLAPQGVTFCGNPGVDCQQLAADRTRYQVLNYVSLGVGLSHILVGASEANLSWSPPEPTLGELEFSPWVGGGPIGSLVLGTTGRF